MQKVQHASANSAKGAKWLVMVYMQASDTSSLDSLAVQDLREMEEGLRGNPNVQVLVQIHRRWPTVPQRYLLKSRGDEPVVAELVEGPDATGPDGEDLTNMGTRPALADLLKAGSAYAAENNCLILWGHAYGIGFGRDHNDPLTLNELRGALLDFKNEQESKGRRRLDVLGTNACTMSYIEAVVELHDVVDYLVASEVFVPLVGLPYKPILSTIGSGTDAVTLGKVLVDRYIDDFETSERAERVAMSVVRVGQTHQVREHLQKLAVEIGNFIGQGEKTNFDRLSRVRDVFLANPSGDTRPVLDLISLTDDIVTLCDQLAPGQEYGDHGGLAQAAKALKDWMTMGDGNLLVYHRGHGDLGDLHGIGVFAPFVVDNQLLEQLELDDDQSKGEQAYKNLLIFKPEKQEWATLVYSRLRLDKPDEIVDATGVVRPADRSAVNQMIVAIEASFNQLRQLLDLMKPRVIAAVQKETETIRTVSERLPEMAGMFGPPYLRLTGDFSLTFTLDEGQAKTWGNRRAINRASGAVTPSALVEALKTIEEAVHRIERATRRVVTNTTFGLGPPDASGAPSVKPLGFGFKPQELGFKPQELGFKPQELGFKQQELGFKQQELGFKQQELGFKPQELGFKQQELGLEQWASQVGALSAFLSSDEQVAMLAVSVLFSRVAVALARLEDAAGMVESTAARFVFRPDYGSLLSTEDYRRVVAERLDAALDVMKEVADLSRVTIKSVLAHPVYGLGPGPAHLGQAERDELASAAGLNGRNLALLEAPRSNV